MSDQKKKGRPPKRVVKLSGAALANVQRQQSVHLDIVPDVTTSQSPSANVNKGGRPSKVSKYKFCADTPLPNSAGETVTPSNTKAMPSSPITPPPPPEKRARPSNTASNTAFHDEPSTSRQILRPTEPSVTATLHPRAEQSIQIPLNGHASVSEAVASRVTGETSILFAFQSEAEALVKDKKLKFDNPAVFAYMCFVAYVSGHRVVIVNTAYTMYHEARHFTADISPMHGAWGDLESFETLIIPVYYSDHYCVVIYERGSTIATFYDPLHYVRDRLTANLRVLLLNAIDAFQPNTDQAQLTIVHADPATFNVQMDSRNCGPHVCLIVESYLMNGSTLLCLDDFDISIERARIVGHLYHLTHGIDPVYHRRCSTYGVENEVGIAEEEIGEMELDAVVSEVEAMLIDEDSPSDEALRSALRRSSRISSKTTTSISDKPSRAASKDKLSSIVQCRKKHGNLGCFAINSGHYYDRFDCGTFGDKVCSFCGAKLLRSETSAACCSNGTVSIPDVERGPHELNVLFDFVGERSHLLQRSCAYNSLLRFGYMESGREYRGGHGAPVLLMNGNVRYKLTNVLCKRGVPNSHGQLYLIDPETATSVSAGRSLFQSLQLKKPVFRQLLEMLKEHHPLARNLVAFRQLYDDALRQARAEGREDVPAATIYIINEREVPDAVRDPSLHPRQVNKPTVGELAVIYIHNDSAEPPEMKRTRLRCIDGTDALLSDYDALLDTAHYPLLFPLGESGYSIGMPKVYDKKAVQRVHDSEAESEEDLDDVLESGSGQPNFDAKKARRQNVSIREFQRYRFALRRDPNGSDHFLFSKGSLVQEYIIDQSWRVQRQHYDFLRQRGALFMMDTEEIREAVRRGLPENCTLGKVLRLEASVYGSPRWYQQQFYDAMTIFTRIGKPTFMITLTANQNWEECKRLMEPGMRHVDRPDVLNRVFYAREKEMRRLFNEKNVLGKAKAHVASLEFQKRGPPHTHRLVYIEGATHDAEFCDAFISAEIPPLPPAGDKSRKADDQRRLREYVLKYQVHTCDPRCMVDKVCTKGFPKAYSDRTYIDEEKPPTYRRRSPDEGGEMCRIRDGTWITNANIVPYNPALLLAWDGHANVEFAYGNMACKYAIKYTFKGVSYAYVRQEQSNTGEVNYDESVALLKGVYRSANEAHTIIYSWRLIRTSHVVVRLSLYEPGHAPHYFHRGQTEKVLAAGLDDDVRLGYFEQFMKQCRTEKENGICKMRKLLYPELPTYYRFDKALKQWVERKLDINVLARIYAVSPAKRELFAIYQLVHHIRGPCSWEDLRTVPGENVPCVSFTKCAVLMGLIDDGKVWDRTLKEAATTCSPRQMRRLFVQILVFGTASDPLALYKSFQKHFYSGKDIKSPAENKRRSDKALLLINRQLHHYGSCNEKFGLPVPIVPGFLLESSYINEAFFANSLDDCDDKLAPDPTCAPSNNISNAQLPLAPILSYSTEPCFLALNPGQQEVVRRVMLALQDRRAGRTTEKRLILMTGQGGTGKTHVYSTIIQLCEKFRLRCLVTASTGIAATLLKRGQTAHSAFRLPLDNEDEKHTPAILSSEILGQIISATDLLIGDEVTMFTKGKLGQIDNACRHCSEQNLKEIPFAGKVVLLGGDFRQLPPVVTKGNLADQAAATIKNSHLFPLFHHIVLTQNMRIQPGEGAFQQLLNNVATDADRSGKFTVPDSMRVHSANDLVQFVYGDCLVAAGTSSSTQSSLEDKLLLAPLRADVARLNDHVLSLIHTPERQYLSTDTAKKNCALDVYAAIHDVVTLNAEIPSGFPPHKLNLKIGAIVVLLRNISVKQGLSNGTRLIIIGFGKDLLHCSIATGPFKGKKIPIARVEFEHKTVSIYGDGLHFTRLQFPVQLAFAMTINKAQGQTVNRLGLFINSPVFTHGQLYTALSRARAQSQLRIFIPHADPQSPAVIKNIVVQSILM